MSDFGVGSYCMFFIMFLIYIFVVYPIMDSGRKGQLIELGVGEYYLDSDNNKQFRTIERKDKETKEDSLEVE
jgi:hypothetical protein